LGGSIFLGTFIVQCESDRAVLDSYYRWTQENKILVSIRDRLIYWPGRYNQLIFGFFRYIGIGQNGRFYQPQ